MKIRKGLVAAVLSVSAWAAGLSCASTTEKSTGTNWIACESDADCERYPGAACDREGFCVDAAGDRIPEGTAVADAGSSGGLPGAGGAAAGGTAAGGFSAGGAGGLGAGGAGGLGAGGACAGVDLQTDPQNCGECGNVCAAPHVAAAECVEGRCRVGVCEERWVFLITVQPFEFGCDYRCPVWPRSLDDRTCDYVDDDCDGIADDDCERCNTVADCAAVAANVEPPGCAVAACEGNVCVLRATDEDLDGVGATCASRDRRFSVLNTGDCNDRDASVHPGAWDGPEDPLNSRQDACNGVDNDCDGMPDSGGICPPDQGGCNGGVGAVTCPCTPGTEVPCVGEGGWPIGMIGADGRGLGVCAAPATLVCPASGRLPPRQTCQGRNAEQEDVCDGIDNDCNGVVDDVLAFAGPGLTWTSCIDARAVTSCSNFLTPRCPTGFVCRDEFCVPE